MCCQAKASKQGQPPGSHFIPEKRLNLRWLFIWKTFPRSKKSERHKKNFEVNFTLLLHILPRWPTGLSLFAYLKGNLNSGFFHDFLLTICIFKDIKMMVRLKSMGFQSKSRKKSIKNEQNQPLPVWGGPLECRYTVSKKSNPSSFVKENPKIILRTLVFMILEVGL